MFISDGIYEKDKRMAVSPAGWLPDPESLEHERFWDGTAWTDRVRDVPPVFDFEADIDFFGKGAPYAPEPVQAPRAPVIRLAPSSLLDPEHTATLSPRFEAAPPIIPVALEPEVPREYSLPGFFAGKVAPDAVVAAETSSPLNAMFDQMLATAPREAPVADEPRRGTWVSTWLVSLGLTAFIAVTAPANPSAAAFGVGAVLALTAIYTLVCGRPSWARMAGRTQSIAPLALGALLLVGASFLPTSMIVAPKFLSPVPAPTAEQARSLLDGWTVIEPRLVGGWEVPTTMERAGVICVNDFASQTPDQEIEFIVSNVRFDTEPQRLTPAQAAAVLDVVRANFCGYPGNRGDVVDSELVWSIPELARHVIDSLIDVAPAGDPGQ